MYKYIHFFFLTFCLKQSIDLLITSDSSNVLLVMFWFLIGVCVGHRVVLLQLTKLDYSVDLFF